MMKGKLKWCYLQKGNRVKRLHLQDCCFEWWFLWMEEITLDRYARFQYWYHSWVRREGGKAIEQRQVIDAKEYYVGFLFINL